MWLRYARYAGGVVAVSVALNLVASWLEVSWAPAKRVSVALVGLGLLAVGLVQGIRSVYSWLRGGRYAVEAIVLDEQHHLMLYWHHFHQRFLPPGGRMGRLELPHIAIRHRLAERVGLSDSQYEFDPRFQAVDVRESPFLGRVRRVPAPFLVQVESHNQRRLVRLHYDFIYVLRTLGPYQPPPSADVVWTNVCFVDLATLENMVQNAETFPDVLDAYKRVLRVLTGPHVHGEPGAS
ncbi:hypothetical protein DVA67_032365 [Solirubrobacter sp. CPCC 204708]|uniref:DUF3137 domain-containing protein n=1 Tax=Solirubrobacter deserti TaxID=2282478 RepID=A0ABT4RR97_9ACTN|nr:hypothetical protein [Solirubrobacter deserti]MBE2320699.1 hypothetical protein [Solirubrobacter deserti]MDA0140923.1 hypothetical protein [Solirubrobacter deserti]